MVAQFRQLLRIKTRPATKVQHLGCALQLLRDPVCLFGDYIIASAGPIVFLGQMVFEHFAAEVLVVPRNFGSHCALVVLLVPQY